MTALSRLRPLGPGPLDPLACYQRTVLSAGHEAAMCAAAYAAFDTPSLPGAPRQPRSAPSVLREDFAGTADIAASWIAAAPHRAAWAIELDRATHDWSTVHTAPRLPDALRGRLSLVHGDSADVGLLESSEDPARAAVPLADVVCALNFSYSVFHTPAALRAYFEAALLGLEPGGVLLLDVLGGPDRERVGLETSTTKGALSYTWTQEAYAPNTRRVRCALSFAHADGRRADRAFVYDWRLWRVHELQDLLAAAGFSKIHIWWEQRDQTGQPTGSYRRVAHPLQEPAYVCYLAAQAG